MKALIYDPYLDTLGGGERYCLTVAECLFKKGWQVDLFWDSQREVKKAIERFALEIGKVGLVGQKPEQLSFWQRFKLEKQYDLIFWLSDGSIPFLFGKKNFLHFQVPFRNLSRQLIYRYSKKVKLRLINKVICNSKFTKKFIDRTYEVNSLVLYPPVDVVQFQPGKKENIILAVGRFEETMQAKRQDVLIRAFIEMVGQGLKGWKFVLIGGSLQAPGENQYLKRLTKMAKNYPIEFLVNVSFSVLKNYYQRAKIFWHAAGFGVDEEREPHRVEHFGITTVEAMAAGAVPVVIDKGGLREIVRRGAGERWKTEKELEKETFNLIKNPVKLAEYRQKDQEMSNQFSKDVFCQRIGQLLQ